MLSMVHADTIEAERRWLGGGIGSGRGSMSAGRVIKTFVKDTAWAAGFELRRRQPTDLADRRVLLARLAALDAVLDVGANEGQWAAQLRRNGYRGPIHSFEPLAAAYLVLADRASHDPWGWRAHRLGLGAVDEERVIHVAGNSTSSSYLPMAAAHSDAAPWSAYIGDQPSRIVTLDSLVAAGTVTGERLYLKIDVQGGEMDVLRGARETLSRVRLLELEMSLVPLYDGQTLAGDMADHLSTLGFALVGLDEGFADPRSGRLLQYDALYARDA